jgi:tRNA (guanine-N7-)-methyltransferase
VPPPDVEELWSALFGRAAPVEIEIGSGDGVFLLAFAGHHPDRNFLGIERSPSKARRLEARLARSGLANLRALRADATCLLPALVPRASVAAYHVYFPDPWPKRIRSSPAGAST